METLHVVSVRDRFFRGIGWRSFQDVGRCDVHFFLRFVSKRKFAKTSREFRRGRGVEFVQTADKYCFGDSLATAQHILGEDA